MRVAGELDLDAGRPLAGVFDGDLSEDGVLLVIVADEPQRRAIFQARAVGRAAGLAAEQHADEPVRPQRLQTHGRRRSRSSRPRPW